MSDRNDVYSLAQKWVGLGEAAESLQTVEQLCRRIRFDCQFLYDEDPRFLTRLDELGELVGECRDRANGLREDLSARTLKASGGRP